MLHTTKGRWETMYENVTGALDAMSEPMPEPATAAQALAREQADAMEEVRRLLEVERERAERDVQALREALESAHQRLAILQAAQGVKTDTVF